MRIFNLFYYSILKGELFMTIKEEIYFKKYRIQVVYEDKVIRITNDENLIDYLKEWGHGAREIATKSKERYYYHMNKELEISTDSMTVEILGHVYPGLMAEAIRGLPAPDNIKKFCRRILKSTCVIDCGESSIDDNRWVWDKLAPFRRVIEAILID